MTNRRTPSRRDILGGIGAGLSLPLFESMLPGGPRARAAGGAPTRLVFFIVPYGCPEAQTGYGTGRKNTFRPVEEGANYTLTECLQPLAAMKGDFSVLSSLHNAVGTEKPGYDARNDHMSLPQSLLTAVSVVYPDPSPFRPELDPMNPEDQKILSALANRPLVGGISVDQVAANHLKTFTPGMPSLELGTAVRGYPSDNYSWADSKTPLSRIVNPAAAFKQVLGVGGTLSPELFNKLNHRRKKVLDHVKGDLSRLQKRLGQGDRERLDQFLTSVNALEGTIVDAKVGSSVCPTPTAPGGYTDRRQQTMQTLDLIPLAFSCDKTRVVTFTLGQYDDDKFPFLDAPYSGYAHHADLSHCGTDENKLQGYVEVTKFKVDMYRYLLDKLKKTKDVDGSPMLDNTTVVFLSEMGYGDGHIPTALPVLVGGKGGGAFHPGKHLVFTGSPVANLYLNLLSSVGVDIPTFGNGTHPLAGL